MSPRSPRGLLALPAALALAGAVALAAGTRPGAGRVELELAAVLPLPDGQAGLLVLRERRRGRLLPIVVPDRTIFAGGARPGEGSLVSRALSALGAELREVELEATEETAEGARVRVAQGNRQVTLPGRPSESIALALSAGAPIWVQRRLLDREGLSPEELEAARREAEGPAVVRL